MYDHAELIAQARVNPMLKNRWNPPMRI